MQSSIQRTKYIYDAQVYMDEGVDASPSIIWVCGRQ